ncbi:MAG: tryptophan 7-halogenase [Polyangiales bacterium]
MPHHRAVDAPEDSVDVAILGGGLAGNLLARQLRLEVPSATVAVYERAESRGWKVGEATVEIAANYFVRRLHLANYLYERQLPKNGLRFFFDDESRSLPLTEMSELGPDALPLWPSFQLDRARLETDLIEMNRSMGVDVELGAAVRDLVLDEADGLHHFVVEQAGSRRGVRARWVVDASGRASIIARQRSLHVPTGHDTTAAWARFRGVADMDAIDAPAWRARVRHTARFLSTVHFCYAGYWIWFIPLAEGVTSVGVVAERSRVSDSVRTEAGFRAFLAEHRAVRDLLEGAELLDFGSYKQLAYGTKRFFSPARWATVGDAAAFTDPFYSPGSDFIAVENDFVADLIRRDLGGEAPASWRERLDTYEAFMQHRFEATLLLYENQYDYLGSYDLMRAKLVFDLAGYYNHWLRPYVLDDYRDLSVLDRILADRTQTLEVMRTFRGWLEKAHAALTGRGAYAAHNRGEFTVEFAEFVPFARDLGARISPERAAEHTTWLFGTSFAMAKDLVRSTRRPESVERATR